MFSKSNASEDAIKKLHQKLKCEHSNAFPLGWQEITPLQFVRETPFNTYTPVHSEYRQMIPEKGETRQDYLTYDTYQKKWRSVAVCTTLHYFHDDTGVAIVCDYWNTEKPIRYFRFGCKHDYRELSMEECRKEGLYHAGRCYHVNKCRKCDNINSYDSSD